MFNEKQQQKSSLIYNQSTECYRINELLIWNLIHIFIFSFLIPCALCFFDFDDDNK